MSDFIMISVAVGLIITIVASSAFLPLKPSNSNDTNYILIKVAYSGNPNITVIQNCTQFNSSIICNYSQNGLVASWNGKIICIEKHVTDGWIKK